MATLLNNSDTSNEMVDQPQPNTIPLLTPQEKSAIAQKKVKFGKAKFFEGDDPSQIQAGEQVPARLVKTYLKPKTKESTPAELEALAQEGVKAQKLTDEIDFKTKYGLSKNFLSASEDSAYGSKVAIARNLEDYVRKDQLPDRPEVLQAILNGKIDTEKVMTRHAEYRAKNPIFTIEQDGQLNGKNDLEHKAAQDIDFVQTGSEVFASQDGKVFQQFGGGYAATSEAAWQKFTAQKSSTLEGEAQLNADTRKAEGILPDPGVILLSRPEVGKSFFEGASFGTYDAKLDNLSPEEQGLAYGLNLLGNYVTGAGVAKVMKAAPGMKQLERASTNLGEKIGLLKNAKVAAKSAQLTEELPQLSRGLLKAKAAKTAVGAAQIAIDGGVIGSVTGAVKSKLQGNSGFDVIKDALTEGTMFAGMGLLLAPVISGTGKLLGRNQMNRQQVVLGKVAAQPEAQAMADTVMGAATTAGGKINPQALGIPETGPLNTAQKLAAEAIDKINRTKPLLGTKAAILSNPEILSQSFDEAVKSTSRSLFGEGGPLQGLMASNPALKTLFESGMHKNALDSVDASMTQFFTENPNAREYVVAPFYVNAEAVNNIYARRFLNESVDIEKYPSLKTNILNYMEEPTVEKLQTFTRANTPKGIKPKLRQASMMDPRLKPSEVDSLVGDVMQDALHTIAGKPTMDVPGGWIGKLNSVDEILKTAIPFNKELNRSFIEAYKTNPMAFDENFIQLKPELLDPVRSSINARTIMTERNITVKKRREISAAMEEIKAKMAISGTEEAAAKLKVDYQVLKDKRTTLNSIMAGQNQRLNELSNTLGRLPGEIKQNLDEIIANIHIPRRNGTPFANYVDERVELGSEKLGIKRQLKDPTLTDGIKADLTNSLRDVQERSKAYIQNYSNFQKQFAKDDNPFFLKAGSELADTMNAFMSTGTDVGEHYKKLFTINNLRRQSQKDFGPNNILEKIVRDKQIREAEINTQGKKLTQVIDSIGIKPKTKESALLQKFGEGRLKTTDPEFLALPAATQQKLIQGVDTARSYYDGLIDQINVTMKAYGLPEVNKRNDYFTHFGEMNNSLPNLIKDFLEGKVKPDDIDFSAKGGMSWSQRGISDPNRTNFYAEKRRSGSEHIDDAISGMQIYMKPALERIYYTDLMRELDTAKQFAPRNLGDVFQNFKDKHLLNVPDNIDQRTGKMAKTILRSGMDKLSKGALTWNVNTAIQQLLSVPQNFASSPMHGMKALQQMFTKDGADIASMSVNLRNRDPLFLQVDREADVFKATVLDKFASKSNALSKIKSTAKAGSEYWDKMGSYALEVFDRVAAKHGFLTGYNQAIQKGLSQKEAAQFGDKWLEMIQNNTSRAAQPDIYKSVVGRAATQFSSFTTNFAASIMNDLPKMAQTDGAPKAVATILRSVAGMSIANEVARSVGIPAPFSIDDAIPFYGNMRFGAGGVLSIPGHAASAGMAWWKGDEQGLKTAKRALGRDAMTVGLASVGISGGNQISKTAGAVVDRYAPTAIDDTIDGSIGKVTNLFTLGKPNKVEDVKARAKKIKGGIIANFNNQQRYRATGDDPYGGTKTFIRDMAFGRRKNDTEDKISEDLPKQMFGRTKSAVRDWLWQEEDKRKRARPFLGRKQAPLQK